MLTKLIWKPQVVCEEIGHVVVQPFQHVQGIINEEDGVIVAVQHPLEVVIPLKMSSQKRRHSSPAQSTEQVKQTAESWRADATACNDMSTQEQGGMRRVDSCLLSHPVDSTHYWAILESHTCSLADCISKYSCK